MNCENKEIIPIFFAADENYLPYLAVTAKSLSDHSSDNYIYDIKILTDGFSEEGLEKLRAMKLKNVTISVVDINEAIKHSRKLLRLRLRDYYSEAIFYRLYISSLFPKLTRAIYIDCDIVLLDDIAKLYFTDMGDNILAAVADESIPCVPPFVSYVRHWVGVEPHEYFNSGVLVMNLTEFRRARIAEKFSELVHTYNFETVAPDQDYLNYLCNGRVKYLEPGWNKQPNPDNPIDREELHLIHYNFYNKPWRYSGVQYEEDFWAVADSTPFGEAIRRGFETYTDEERKKDAEGGEKLVGSAAELSLVEGGFRITLGDSYRAKSTACSKA